MMNFGEVVHAYVYYDTSYLPIIHLIHMEHNGYITIMSLFVY